MDISPGKFSGVYDLSFKGETTDFGSGSTMHEFIQIDMQILLRYHNPFNTVLHRKNEAIVQGTTYGDS